ncbi:hypothetical protein OCH239_13775 [Roseivivax halodurans JCM 10272]|uniref:Uncharacterized protein n=1 Tax=Roseivivax halodurans JCM 10272 TaxID=1449350 RepID=X7EKJ8_9RHOB|nr:hypothetical protein [Roseivivax halodurans]ETX15688.1 hypothetical protein OCH239_13775 [Roseivivax halodurans JCM 10272]
MRSMTAGRPETGRQLEDEALLLRRLPEKDMQTYNEMPLEELFARALASARNLARDFPCNDVSVDAHEASSMRRTLEGLSHHAGLTASDDVDADLLMSVLARELDRETTGWSRIFDGWIDPDIGQIGTIKSVRVLTERGQMLERHARGIQEFAHVRSLCRARRDAEKLLLRA